MKIHAGEMKIILQCNPNYTVVKFPSNKHKKGNAPAYRVFQFEKNTISRELCFLKNLAALIPDGVGIGSRFAFSFPLFNGGEAQPFRFPVGSFWEKYAVSPREGEEGKR